MTVMILFPLPLWPHLQDTTEGFCTLNHRGTRDKELWVRLPLLILRTPSGFKRKPRRPLCSKWDHPLMTTSFLSSKDGEPRTLYALAKSPLLLFSEHYSQSQHHHPSRDDQNSFYYAWTQVSMGNETMIIHNTNFVGCLTPATHT